MSVVDLRYDAVILAGGAGRRLGGPAKPVLPVGGTPMLLRVLHATAGAAARTVVGPPELARLLPPGVRLLREEPPGGGPVAALAAGLGAGLGTIGGVAGSGATVGVAEGAATLAESPEVGGVLGGLASGGAGGLVGVGAAGGAGAVGTAGLIGGDGATGAGSVAVLAADLPLLTATALAHALAALGGHDGAVYVDDDGRPQWLCGVWRAAVLHRRVAGLAATGPLAGRSLRELFAPLRIATVTAPAGTGRPWYDCDTPEQLTAIDRDPLTARDHGQGDS